MQLVAYGAQDVYLGGGYCDYNIDYNYSKITNRKYNNFKLYNVKYNVNGCNYRDFRNEGQPLNETIQNIFDIEIVDYPFSSFKIAKLKISKFFKNLFDENKPKITFWKVNYKRHENFSIEQVEQSYNGEADFGRRVTCTISRDGDLAYKTTSMTNNNT